MAVLDTATGKTFGHRADGALRHVQHLQALVAGLVLKRVDDQGLERLDRNGIPYGKDVLMSQLAGPPEKRVGEA